MPLAMGTIRTPTGYSFRLPSDTYKSVPVLSPKDLVGFLAVSNPNFEAELFSKGNLTSIFRTLCQRYLRETESSEGINVKCKEAVQKFKAVFDNSFHGVYLVLHEKLANVPAYPKYRDESGDALSNTEFCEWVIHCVNYDACPEPIAQQPGGIKIEDSGNSPRDQYEDGRMTAQIYRDRFVRTARMLVVSLPAEAQADDENIRTHLHLHQDYGKRCSRLSYAIDFGMDHEPALTIEFSDRATKELAKMALSRVKWSIDGIAEYEFVVRDYEEGWKDCT